MKVLPSLSACLVAFGTLVFANAGFASTPGTDNASATAYNDGWQTGDNGSITGAGFTSWNLNSNGTAGFFVGNSTTLNPGNTGANINSGGSALGMYGASGANANAYRNFNNGALTQNQYFSLDLAANYRNGYKGIDLQDANGNTIFNFNIGSDDYSVGAAASGNGSIGNTYSANSAFHLVFTQTSASGGTWTITRSGGVTDFDSGTYSGSAAGFHLYVGNTDGGDPNNLFANNFAVVVPEPATWLAGVLTVGAFGWTLRRRLRRTA